jgi:hypothetical protein
MPLTARVIGRVDIAEQVCQALRSAGVEVELATAGPMNVFASRPPAEGVDVTIATSMFDPSLWRLAKLWHPDRPMLALAERERESALRSAVRRRHGPDAYLTWPATGAALADGVRRAVEASAGRHRTWSLDDLTLALVWVGFFLFNMGFVKWLRPIGLLVAGIGLLLRAHSAWSRVWTAIGGAVLLGLGIVALAVLRMS